MVLDRFELVNLAEERHVLALGAGGAPIYDSDWGLLITQAGQVWVHQKSRVAPSITRAGLLLVESAPPQLPGVTLQSIELRGKLTQ